MSSSFKNRYPDFASIEQHIRRAHAERQVAIATAFADAILGTIRGQGQVFAGKTSAPAPAPQSQTARV